MVFCINLVTANISESGPWTTQQIFYENKNVRFISTHQCPYYPGSGSEQEKGKFNNIYNIFIYIISFISRSVI